MYVQYGHIKLMFPQLTQVKLFTFSQNEISKQKFDALSNRAKIITKFSNAFNYFSALMSRSYNFQ